MGTNKTAAAAEKSRFQVMLEQFGLPRLILSGFLLLLLVMAPFVGVDLPTQITNIINRFSWNAVLVLALVPMVHSGCGLNFGLPLAVICGLMGGTLSIQLGFTGAMSFLMAVIIATPFAVLLGGGYGLLLNRIKGGEMMIATYVGLSIMSFFCMMWLLLPYNNPKMVYGLSASGLRPTISLEGFYDQTLANLFKIDFHEVAQSLHISLGPLERIKIPTGSLLVFALLALLIWAFLDRKSVV